MKETLLKAKEVCHSNIDRFIEDIAGNEIWAVRHSEQFYKMAKMLDVIEAKLKALDTKETKVSK